MIVEIAIRLVAQIFDPLRVRVRDRSPSTRVGGDEVLVRLRLHRPQPDVMEPLRVPVAWLRPCIDSLPGAVTEFDR